MEKYDVIIIGNGLGISITSIYLINRLRNVAFFHDGENKLYSDSCITVKDKAENEYTFNTLLEDINGFNKDGLLTKYLKEIGFKDKLAYTDNPYDVIIKKPGVLKKRYSSIDEYITYLKRYYPNERKNIEKFSVVFKELYKNYCNQKLNKIKDEVFSIPICLVDMAEFSLNDILKRHFKDVDLINEISHEARSFKLDVNKISAYRFFIKWFDKYFGGSHFLDMDINTFSGMIDSKIKKNKKRVFSNRKVTEYIIENNRIVKIIDNLEKEIYADYFVLDSEVEDFVKQYDKENLTALKDDKLLFPNKQDNIYIRKAFIVLKGSFEQYNIVDNIYYFTSTDELDIISMVNVSKVTHSKDLVTKLQVTFIDNSNIVKSTMCKSIVDALAVYFKFPSKIILASTISEKSLYYTSIHSPKFWADKSLNDYYCYDSFKYFNPYDNVYFMKDFLLPESSISGLIQSAIDTGDLIDDRLYFGDNEENFIRTKELMLIINGEFVPHCLGKKEKNIQFYIGKHTYFIRVKDKYSSVYKGVCDVQPDIVIKTINDTLYDLTVGNITIEEAYSIDTFKYEVYNDTLDVEDNLLMAKFVDGFGLGVDKGKKLDYEFFHHKLGNKFLIAMMTIWTSYLFSIYIFDYLIATSVAITLVSINTLLKKKILNSVALFDIFSIVYLGLIFLYSIVSHDFNISNNNNLVLLIFSLVLFISWIINKPLTKDYIKHDYRNDFTYTKFFKTMCGGITFIWASFFIVVTFATFILSERYELLTYYGLIVVYYLSYTYSEAFVDGNIKK